MAQLTFDHLLDGTHPLPSGKIVTPHPLGDLELPTGLLVARDPLAGAPAPPFSFALELEPGRYPTSLRMLVNPAAPPAHVFHDVAALVIRFRSGPCTRWALALTDDDPALDEVPAGTLPGFMVDSATAALVDDSFQALFEADAIRKQLWAGKRTPPGGALVGLGGARNVALCTSGAGDGIYPAWVGFAGDGAAVALIVDFKLVELDRRLR